MNRTKTIEQNHSRVSSARTIDRALRELQAKLQKVDPPETFDERMVLLVEIYTIIKRIFRSAAEFPMVPPLWRDTLEQFTDLFEVVAAEYNEGVGASPDFKAGRDL